MVPQYPRKQADRAWNHVSRTKWEIVRRAALKRDGRRCRRCGNPGRLEVHHVEPVHRAPGLALSLDNAICVCRSCHLAIHRPERLPGADEFVVMLDDLLK